METTINLHFIDYVADSMRKTAVELEKFEVTATLGKMEAMNVFEQVKESYSNLVHDIDNRIDYAEDRYNTMKAKVEALRLQLYLGKADTLEKYVEQRNRILHAIHEVRSEIIVNPRFIRGYAVMLDVLERLQVKLEVLNDYMETGSEKTRRSMKDRMETVENIIKDLRKKFTTIKEDHFDIFQKEMTEAYAHLKNAFIQTT
jgi:chaperonin cofactor prefoldin